MSEHGHQYRPHSADAMFSRILQRLDEMSGKLQEIKEQVSATNGRVTTLEREKWHQRGIVAGLSVAATALWQWFTGRGGP